MNKQEIQQAINHLTMLRRLDSGEKKSIYDTAISALTQQLTNGWIPVDSKLPEECRDKHGVLIPYLVCVSETERPFRAFYDGKKWGDGMFELDVTAWQPLPEPYKEAL